MCLKTMRLRSRLRNIIGNSRFLLTSDNNFDNYVVHSKDNDCVNFIQKLPTKLLQCQCLSTFWLLPRDFASMKRFLIVFFSHLTFSRSLKFIFFCL